MLSPSREGDSMKEPPESPQTAQHYGIEELKEGPQFLPHYAERRQPIWRPMELFSAWSPCGNSTTKSRLV